MAEGTSKRQANNAVHFPQWIWEWIGVEEGGVVVYRDDEGKHGRFISFWRKEK